jgi:hypothetical protein|tara:strand:- start:126 stop:425 length:300 start_codon:yes stop_codon:yes gene_type:complete
MGSNHGNRVYIQVLLDEHRGQMFLADAKLQNKKPAAWMREIVYQYLERSWGDPAYKEASDKDKDNYQRGVNARLVGRGLKPKPLGSEVSQSGQDIDSSN